MVEKTVMLSNFQKLKRFVADMETLSYDVTAVFGKKEANAKMIEELFVFDLTKPITVIADTTSVAAFSKIIKPYEDY